MALCPGAPTPRSGPLPTSSVQVHLSHFESQAGTMCVLQRRGRRRRTSPAFPFPRHRWPQKNHKGAISGARSSVKVGYQSSQTSWSRTTTNARMMLSAQIRDQMSGHSAADLEWEPQTWPLGSGSAGQGKGQEGDSPTTVTPRPKMKTGRTSLNVTLRRLSWARRLRGARRSVSE